MTRLPSDVLEVSVSPLNQFYIPVRTYSSSETDKEIAYFPDGNEKYAVYTVDTTDPEEPLLEVEIKIHGGAVWKKVFAGKKLGEIEGRSFLEKGWGWIERVAWPQ